MTAWTDSSEQLQDLAWQALDHAVNSLDGGGPLIPFALVASDKGVHLARFAAESLEEGLQGGRGLLASLSPEEGHMVALAYDGYLTREGVRSDAVFVEAQQRGMTASASIAQRYVPSDDAPELLGNPADAGDVAPLLSEPAPEEAPAKTRGWFRRR